VDQFPDMKKLPNPLWSDVDQFPDMKQLRKITLFLTGICVSQVSGWIFLSNGIVQYKYLFPKTDRALSDWKTSRIYLSVPLESKHNKFFVSSELLYNFVPQVLKHLLLPLGNIHFRTCQAGNALTVSFQTADTTLRVDIPI
jgi:hypothetical protein